MLGFGNDDSVGGAGINFKAEKAPVMWSTNSGQVDTGFNTSTEALQRQREFVNAINGANGIGNQQAVFQQLQGVANGTGPNPAQAALANATGQNVSNQAALMASARGAGANPALIARQAAMQGAGIQQNAAGQAAALQAQQQLAAMGQLGGIAGQQVAQQAGAIQGFNQNAQGLHQNVLGAMGAMNSANVANSSQANAANAGIAKEVGGQQADLFRGALEKVGSAAQSMAGGGAAPMASGGEVAGPRSRVGQHFKGLPAPTANVGDALKSGGAVPGKPKVAGDSVKNDTVNARLSPGEIVIPRSIAQGPDAGDKARAFVEAVLAQQGMRRK